MEDSISFDKTKLETLVSAVATFDTSVKEANDVIQEQIGIINANWSGEIHDTAKVDLDSVSNNMAIIVENTSQALGILTGVQEGFEGTKY